MREQTLQEIASESSLKNWSEYQCHIAVYSAAIDAVLAKKLESRGSVDTMVDECRLAGHADVRGEFGRLMALRDEVWESEAQFLRNTLHGPSQVLVDIMRRQRNADERHHVATAADYLRYLRKRFNI